MSARLDALRDRRLALVARSDTDRDAVAATFDELAGELHIADRVVATAQRLSRHHVWVGVAAAGLVLAPVLMRRWIRSAGWWLPVAIGVFRLTRKKRTSD
jgi:hypothetical protein